MWGYKIEVSFRPIRLRNSEAVAEELSKNQKPFKHFHFGRNICYNYMKQCFFFNLKSHELD